MEVFIIRSLISETSERLTTEISQLSGRNDGDESELYHRGIVEALKVSGTESLISLPMLIEKDTLCHCQTRNAL